MIDRLAGTPSPSVQRVAQARQADRQPDQASRFARALYGALRPPTLDLADASGDFEHEEGTRPAMTATVVPNPAASAKGGKA